MSSGSTLLESPVPTSDAVPRAAAVPARALVGLVLVLAAHLPILWRYCDSLISLPQYEYILALPIFAAVLIYSRARDLGILAPGAWVTSAALFVVSAGMLLVSGVFDSPWLGAISSLAAWIAGVYALGGGRLTWATVPAWLVLWLMIRLPFASDLWLVQSLQTLAAQKASTILHLIGQPHLLDGNVVETPLKRYAVEEACSGVQSLFAITACTVFFVLWSRMSWWRSLLILGIAWWWVWAANVARIVIVTYFNSNFDWPIDKGWMHDALGIALFAATLGLVVSSGHLLWFILPYGIFGGRDGTDQPAVQPHIADELHPTRLPAFNKTFFASIFLVLLYSVALVLLWGPQLRVPKPSASPGQLNLLEESFAPQEVAGWRLVPGSHRLEERDLDSQWGARSQNWTYEKNGRRLIVSLDYPFLGWHELGVCYHFGGWTFDSRDVVEFSKIAPGAKNGGDFDRVVETKMRRKLDHDYGFLIYQCFNNRREPMPIPESNVFVMLKNRLSDYRKRVATLGATGGERHDQAETYQLQVFIQDKNPLLPQDYADMRQLFASYRALFDTTLPTNTTSAPASEATK